MQTTRVTRSSVLGKRGHHQQLESSPPSLASKSAGHPQTPDSTPLPKRPRVSTLVVDGDGNKENVPPFSPQLLTPDPSPVATRTARALRRSGTEIISPSRARPNIRRHASTSTIASIDTASDPHLFSFTPPPIPVSFLPLHTRARTLLRATCNSADNEIAGRDAERATIHDFITSFADDASMDTDDMPTTLYISGSPGCGKTALLNSVLSQMNPESKGVKIIFINCMALNNLDALWERMFEELDAARKQKFSPSKARKVKGRDAIEALLAGLRTKCVLILDELDHITPNGQTLTSLFSLPAATPLHLRLIGIANTHTLTSTSSSSSPSLNVHTVHFAPYTSNQLFDILQARLRSLYDAESDSIQGDPKKFLPTPTLTLLTKKIAGMTGDVRSLFEVLRGAIDIAVAPSKNKSAVTASNVPAVSVTPSHVNAALKAYKPSSGKSMTSPSSGITVGTSETVTKVKNLNLQARLVLLAVLLASKRLEAGLTLSGSPATTSPRKPAASSLRRTASSTSQSTPSVANMDTNQLHTYYTAVLNRSDSSVFDPTTRSEFGDLLNVLEGNGLVCLSSSVTVSAGSPSRKSFARSMSFGGGLAKGGTAGNVGSVRLVGGVWCDEILRGLGVNTTPQEGVEVDVCEEEVKAIWQREQGRIAKDVKAKDVASSKGSHEDVFDGAFEH
ncbi:P-loop containing nucleoside triphosphate hydrolase protein [Macrolepiota fuliginosa MF-IS2]|uniref:P-loop containing nucleoside triphosphate hydrolase protein n=1 Tax=Macrolepiota fuliginosa MF-IS2 TaxID=1400762 RepID=A0A9P5XBA2_9AGAR|nr:P-loop containing nucleoside triphosphate hydrolase protein [Macrolepiota fuliginosa MF-IS2]